MPFNKLHPYIPSKKSKKGLFHFFDNEAMEEDGGESRGLDSNAEC
jgi:hypothetical protein